MDLIIKKKVTGHFLQRRTRKITDSQKSLERIKTVKDQALIDRAGTLILNDENLKQEIFKKYEAFDSSGASDRDDLQNRLDDFREQEKSMKKNGGR